MLFLHFWKFFALVIAKSNRFQYHIGTFNKEIIEEARSRGDLFFVGFHAILKT